MLSSRWYKVINDLLGNKTRTLLIVLSIAVGLFAVGTILSARAILSAGMAQSYAAINPSSGVVRTLELFDMDFVRSVQATEGVEEADARRTLYARVQVAPNQWNNLTIFAIEDYDHIRVNKIWHQKGAWPPPERELLIERAALAVIQAEVGDEVLIETPDEKQRWLRIAGTVHDMAQMPAQIDNSPYAYISFETLEWLGEPYGFNELYIVAGDQHDKGHARDVVNQVKSKAEKSGLTIPMTMTAEPGQVPLDDILQAVLLLMGTLGVLALFLSMFLIVNTVSALLAQQRRQIGVMKAIGARTGQIMETYLGMVAVYGLLALLISVPLSIVGARALSRFMASMFNFDLIELSVPPYAILLQLGVGLLVPILASLYPFVANLRITPAEAMSAYPVGRGRFGAAIVDRLLSGANLWFARTILLRPIVLSLRNTFRSKGRLALTLITMTLASAIFVSVFNVRASLFSTLDDLMAIWHFDIMVTFAQAERTEKITQEIQHIPGVAQTDIWLQMPVRRVRPNGSESSMIYLFAPHADSELAHSPVIIEGRWLLPEDENAIVVTTNFTQEEPDVRLGDDIVLKIGGRERRWRVVGIGRGFMLPMVYANYPYVADITGQAGLAGAALIKTEQHIQSDAIQVSTALESHFEHAGMGVSSTQTMLGERSEMEAAYGIVISLMLIMAALLATVGGLGLMGAMSINVLERTREIGVLRAIGAPNRGVAQVFIVEGILIGLLSWLLGSLLAIPMSRGISDAVGLAIAGAPLTFSYSMGGVWLWLLLVTILSALASFIPARNASRLTVREVLAYE